MNGTGRGFELDVCASGYSRYVRRLSDLAKSDTKLHGTGQAIEFDNGILEYAVPRPFAHSLGSKNLQFVAVPNTLDPRNGHINHPKKII